MDREGRSRIEHRSNCGGSWGIGVVSLLLFVQSRDFDSSSGKSDGMSWCIGMADIIADA